MLITNHTDDLEKGKTQNKENPTPYTDWWENQENSIKCKNPKQPTNPARLSEAAAAGKARLLPAPRAANIFPARCDPLQSHSTHRGQNALPELQAVASAPHSTLSRAGQTKSTLAPSESPRAGQGVAGGLGAPTCFGTGATLRLPEAWLASHPKELDRTWTHSWDVHVLPPRKSLTGPRGAASPCCQSGSLIGKQLNGLTGLKN